MRSLECCDRCWRPLRAFSLGGGSLISWQYSNHDRGHLRCKERVCIYCVDKISKCCSAPLIGCLTFADSEMKCKENQIGLHGDPLCERYEIAFNSDRMTVHARKSAKGWQIPCHVYREHDNAQHMKCYSRSHHAVFHGVENDSVNNLIHADQGYQHHELKYKAEDIRRPAGPASFKVVN